MKPLEQVDEFLTRAGTFYLTTVEGDRPRCRPIGFHLLEGDRLYFGVGDFKAVYRQMRENPHVELCAVVGKEFPRYHGEAIFETDDAIVQRALDAMPAMRELYNEKTGYHLAIFHLEHATAEFRNMLGAQEAYSFD